MFKLIIIQIISQQYNAFSIAISLSIILTSYSQTNYYNFLTIKIFIQKHIIKINTQHRLFNIIIHMSKSPKSRSPQKSAETDEMRDRAREGILKRTKKQKPFYEKYAYHIAIGAFIVIVGFGLINSLWRSGPNINTTFVNDEAYINEKNAAGLTFKVAANPMFNDYKLADAKLVFNNQASNKQQLYRCQSSEKATIIPESYNFRTQHPECARPIETQGNCSSTYSLAAVSAVNDRLCLQNNESFVILSPQTPIACDKSINNQCRGGYVSRTLDYAKIYGLVEQSCYSYDETDVTNVDCANRTKQCVKHKISDYCVSSTEDGIKQQIFNHGPIIVVIPVYRDFLIYKEGLYQVYPKNQRFPSGHAVKLIGWDQKEGKNCWIIENTWGTEWGVQGTACVLIGQQELDIERFALAPALITEQKQSTEQQGEAEQFKQTTEQVDIDENTL